MVNRILITTLILLILSPIIASQDSFKIQNEKVIFTIEAPKEGIYGQAYLYQNNTKITTLKLCAELRCYKTFQTSISYENFSLAKDKEYKLLYYDFNKYLWKNLSFQIPSNIDASKKINGQVTQDTGPIASTTISVICAFYTLFNSEKYAECKQEYISRA
jgi:hypothetical protein